MDKDTTWEMDYRKMASMAQFMVELPEELPLVGTLHEELLQQNKSGNEELGIFLKLLNRQNSKKLHWLKPGSLNCKKTC
jgi:hypothetical protein